MSKLEYSKEDIIEIQNDNEELIKENIHLKDILNILKDYIEKNIVFMKNGNLIVQLDINMLDKILNRKRKK